jgi:hypothetical protein
MLSSFLILSFAGVAFDGLRDVIVTLPKVYHLWQDRFLSHGYGSFENPASPRKILEELRYI